MSSSLPGFWWISGLRFLAQLVVSLVCCVLRSVPDEGPVEIASPSVPDGSWGPLQQPLASIRAHRWDGSCPNHRVGPQHASRAQLHGKLARILALRVQVPISRAPRTPCLRVWILWVTVLAISLRDLLPPHKTILQSPILVATPEIQACWCAKGASRITNIMGPVF